ncbi:MAG TPA: hypothetical protein VFO10_16015 [Oligoflexus sp.]|uniref:hypothetical protein n=1 Tax=Oligoflexus sp. TaxID=1971216 RepID=UPI002D7F3984|nr:hypothetical protein [Oligoflexus sp.]HET9238767.1 hypothetical protein [Oligoflexus sp.]
MKEFGKKVLRFLGLGAIWVFLLSIPIKGQMLFIYATETFVPYGLVAAIGNQVETAWYKSKAMARNALSDAESEKERRF